jgi:hypothetical protein
MISGIVFLIELVDNQIPVLVLHRQEPVPIGEPIVPQIRTDGPQMPIRPGKGYFVAAAVDAYILGCFGLLTGVKVNGVGRYGY